MFAAWVRPPAATLQRLLVVHLWGFHPRLERTREILDEVPQVPTKQARPRHGTARLGVRSVRNGQAGTWVGARACARPRWARASTHPRSHVSCLARMQLLPYKRQKLFLSLEALSFGTLPVGTAAEQLIVVYSTSHVRQRTRTDAPTRLCLKQSGESAVAVSI